MSLLVPDYSSSSEDEAPPRVAQPTRQSSAQSPAPPIAAPGIVEHAVEAPKTVKKKATKKKKAAKLKTTLHLPPEIQRLLESGAVGDSDSDGDGDSLLAKQKRAVAKRPRAATATPSTTSAAPATLSFLPAPKHHIHAPKPKPAVATPAASDEPVDGDEGGTVEAAVAPDATVGADQQQQQQDYYDPQTQQYYDAEQYAQYYAQYYQQQQQQGQEYAAAADAAEQQPGKRARHRDRELERMLQMGQFTAVADKIVEVAAPAPDAWQAPPVERLQKGSASELKVKASFWNSSAGTAVASVKPSRLQRQKHQLNQLAFDAKAREFELLDRKGAAIKTKRETHAKYGW